MELPQYISLLFHTCFFLIDLDGLKIGGSHPEMLYYSYKALYNFNNK
jgi:hypothetical protein